MHRWIIQYCDFEDLGDFEDLKDFELLFFLSVLLTIREILERLERDSGDASWSPDQSDQSAPCRFFFFGGMPAGSAALVFLLSSADFAAPGFPLLTPAIQEHATFRSICTNLH